MRYEKQVMADGAIDEIFEGEVSEILELLNSMPQELKCEGFNQGISIGPVAHTTDIELMAGKLAEHQRKASPTLKI